MYPDTGLIKERVTATVPNDGFVVFLIGMRINRPWKLHKWLPVGLAMNRMISELQGLQDAGLRHCESWFGRTTMMVQYWDSFAALEAYALAKDREHLPAWNAFNNAVASNGEVGIWHETYVIKPGQFECVYNNMPRFGLSRAFTTAPATGSAARARTRLASTANTAAKETEPA